MGDRQSAPALATTTDELRRTWVDHMVDDGFRRALAFTAHPDDVFVACYLKCGTTWTQHIAHGLRTGGDLDFDNLEFVIPWLERAHGLGVSIDMPQRAAPRLFKTHLERERTPRGARYIVTIRDPGDALVSLYRFFAHTFFDPAAISLDEFARDFYCRPNGVFARYWEHLVSWLTAPEIGRLVLCFEDMVADLPGAVSQIARFMGLDVARGTFDRVVQQSSFGFMKQHRDRFATVAHVEGRPPVRFDIVRTGRVGDHRQALSPAMRAMLDEIWRQVVEPATGFASYSALRASGRAC